MYTKEFKLFRFLYFILGCCEHLKTAIWFWVYLFQGLLRGPFNSSWQTLYFMFIFRWWNSPLSHWCFALLPWPRPTAMVIMTTDHTERKQVSLVFGSLSVYQIVSFLITAFPVSFCLYFLFRFDNFWKSIWVKEKWVETGICCLSVYTSLQAKNNILCSFNCDQPNSYEI